MRNLRPGETPVSTSMAHRQAGDQYLPPITKNYSGGNMATITFLPAKDNLKMRRYKRNGEYYKQRNELKAKQKSRSVEEIWDSIFGVEKPERPVLSLKPTKHYPSGDNCCLPNVAVFSGVKTKQPSSEFWVTARG